MGGGNFCIGGSSHLVHRQPLSSVIDIVDGSANYHSKFQGVSMHTYPQLCYKKYSCTSATTEQGPESALGSAPSVSSTYFCKPSASTFSSWAARPYIGCLPRGDPFIAVAVRSTEQRGQSHVSVGQSAFGSVSIAPPGVLCFECLVCHFFNKELEQLN